MPVMEFIMIKMHANTLKGRNKPTVATEEVEGILQGQWHCCGSLCTFRSQRNHLGQQQGY
uniref:Uncharacterized protein n=1 Tax=Rhizophora mucronata TaxID=61149 RepID=A0A2P2QQJ6_RHIMU